MSEDIPVPTITPVISESPENVSQPFSLAPRPEKDDLVLLANNAIRARRRPVAILSMWLWQTTLALVIAWPAAAIVKSYYGDHPQGDAVLWSPEGFELVDLVFRAQPARAALFVLIVIVSAVAAVVGLLPLGALLSSIAFSSRDLRQPSLRQTLARGVAAFRSMSLLFVIAVSAQALIVTLGAILGGALASGLASNMGEATADQLGGLVFVIFLFIAFAMGVLHDLSRAAIIRFRVRGIHALRLGMNALRRTPVIVLWSWTWRSAAALIPLAVGSLVADRLGGRGGFTLFVMFLIHQGILLTRIALRASWLAKALRAVDHAHRVLRTPHAN